MNNVGQLIRDANPIQGEPSLLADDELGALLLLAQTRSGNVDVQELTRTVEPRENRWNGWLIAAAAFAAVILFVGVAMLLSGQSSGLPPATTPATTPPTTQAASTTTEAAAAEEVDEATPTTAAPVDNGLGAADQEFAEAFVSAFNERDHEAILQFFDPSATFKTSIQTESDLDQFSDELSYRWALNAQWNLQDCKFELSIVICGISVSRDDFPGTDAPLPATLRLVVEDGAITSMNLFEKTATILSMAESFYGWVEENHSGLLDQMTRGDGQPPFPSLTEESIALWVELIPQYKASLDG